MARYIDADKANEEIDAFQTSLESNDDKVWRRNKPYYKGLAIARGIINDMPAADVVPRSEVEKFELIHKHIKNIIFDGRDYETLEAYESEYNKELSKLADIIAAKAEGAPIVVPCDIPDVEIEQLKAQLEASRLEKAGFEEAAKQIIEGLKAELEKYRSVVERDIVIVGRRQGKEAESREIIRYRADLIREAAVREFAESLLEGRVGNDPVSVVVRVGLKSYLEDKVECPDCKRFVGCEKANWVRGCEEYREDGEKDYFTPEEVRKMSQAEVRQNYAKIINSMSKWHEEHG